MKKLRVARALELGDSVGEVLSEVKASQIRRAATCKFQGKPLYVYFDGDWGLCIRGGHMRYTCLGCWRNANCKCWVLWKGEYRQSS